MDIPLFCVFLMILWSVFSKGPMAWAMARLPGGYNNREPRVQRERLEGWSRRAFAAHQNTLEALPMFGLSVLMYKHTGDQVQWVDWACVTFVAVRLLYVYAYIKDSHLLRSGFWTAGFMICLAIAATSVF